MAIFKRLYKIYLGKLLPEVFFEEVKTPLTESAEKLRKPKKQVGFSCLSILVTCTTEVC